MNHLHRRTFLKHSAVFTSAALLARPLSARNVNEKLNLGFIGLGARSKELLPLFTKLANVRVAALCDVDQQRLDKAAEEHKGAKKYGDLRKLLEDRDVDAVVIATCNHWHVLAAIWACEYGKDVYVEKPLCHNHWEGRQLVRAARKHDRIVQMGTQQRSDPIQAEIKQFLHEDKKLGEIKYVQVCRFGPRDPIGKRTTPLEIPKSVNYDLWLGPARDEPIYRDKLHYDWHWEWNTGNGELGNWGVHVLDDAVNVAFRDRVPFPKRVAAAGGRVAWHDAGETPNVVFAYYDTGSVPLLFGLSNLPDKSQGKKKEKGLKIENMGTGYIVHCDGGYYAGGRGKGAAHGPDGKVIREFTGDSGLGSHQRNFVDAVFAHDRKKLNCEVQIGHQSTAWCNLADVAQRAGRHYSHHDAVAVRRNFEPWGNLVELIEQHLARNKVDVGKSKFQLCPLLEFDATKERFVGENSENANRFLRREYRRQFEVPAIS
jgi:predicted dehydrogenase